MNELQPNSLGILLCDQVIEDKRTNKKTLVGLFNDIVTQDLPTKHPVMYLVLTMTNCRHPHDFTIEISRDNEHGGERIATLHSHSRAHNPLDIIDMVFELRGVPLTNYGKYTIDVLLAESRERIAQRSFFVRQLRRSPSHEDKDEE